MKKLFYTLSLVVMGLATSYAQKAKHVKLTPVQKAAKETGLMQQTLGLSTEQQSKIQSIQLERFQKSEAWKADTLARGDRAKLKERKDFIKANKEKIKAVLTPEQQAKWDAYQSEQKTKHKHHKS